MLVKRVRGQERCGRKRERIKKERQEEGEQRLKSKCERGDTQRTSLRFQGLPASRCAPMGKPNFTLGGDSPTLPGGFFRVVTNTSRYYHTLSIL